MELVELSFEKIDPEHTKNALVVKHNYLIEARYQAFTVVEQRIIFMLLGQIQKDDKDFKAYRVSVADFSRLTGLPLNGSFYENLRNTLVQFRQKNIHIKRDHGGFLVTGWVADAEYHPKEGWIELSISPKLKPYLLELKAKYTQYQLDVAIQFRSQYSIRLYECLKKEAQIVKEYKRKDNFEKKYSYEELREIFSIEEIDYKLFSNFKNRVLEPAVKEISDKSDLNITQVDYLKTGRKITHVCFYVSIRSREEANTRTDNLRLEDIAPEAPKEENHPIFSALENYGISFEVAIKLKNEYGIKRIERNITYLNAQLKAGKAINDKPAFLTQAIKDDYGNALELEEKKKKEAIAKQKAEEEAKRKKELEEKRKAEEQTQKNIKTIEAFALLPAGLRKVIKQGFMETIKDNAFKLEKWNKWQELNDDSTLKSEAFFRSEFVKYLIENNFIE
jgi:plasmid replication initiation protein